MENYRFLSRATLTAMAGTMLLAACGDNKAVLLPLQYPDGSAVTTVSGDPVMAGYQTFGSSLHPNAIALYDQARPGTCATCARLGAVVTEPSALRQYTGILGAATVGAGAVMGGLGMMNYGNAALEGKLQDKIIQNNSEEKRHHGHKDGYASGDGGNGGWQSY